MATLVHRAAKLAYLLDGEAVVIGRHPACSIRVLEKRVSRNHCILVASDKGWVLRDQGSKLGTYLNDEFVARPQLLHPGDRILVGGTEFVFEEKSTAPEGLRLERVRAVAAKGLDLAEFQPEAPPRRRRLWPVLAIVGLGAAAAAAALLVALPFLTPETPSRAVRRAAGLVRARNGAELWARLSAERRAAISVEELADRLNALPEAAILALRSLELGSPQPTNQPVAQPPLRPSSGQASAVPAQAGTPVPRKQGQGAVVPVAIRIDGDLLRGEVVLVREGDSWKVHAAPVQWVARLAP